MENEVIPTDWTRYYQAKKNFFVNAVSTYTQKFTNLYILKALNKYFFEENNFSTPEILELGGGGSCFADNICRNIKLGCYDIIDNNELSVELFNKKKLSTKSRGMCFNLLQKNLTISKQYDFVYSIGLIEHFRNNDIKTVIEKHFDFCKSGGIVFISFPTPTKKYRFIRFFMEKLGIWYFTDEEALKFDQIKEYFTKKGMILENFENKKLPLSQFIIIARKN